MCCIHFFRRKLIIFDFILMLHSKSNVTKRKQLFEPLINNLGEIINNLSSNIGIVCPINLVHEGVSGYTYSKLRKKI